VCRPLGCIGTVDVDPPLDACLDSLLGEKAYACRRTDALEECPVGGSEAGRPRLAVSCAENFLQIGDSHRCDFTDPRPKAISASFVDGGRLLVLAFNSEISGMNGSAIGESVHCAAIFEDSTARELGDEALCVLGSSRHLFVRLGFGAELGISEASTAVIVSDTSRQYGRLDEPIEVLRYWENPSQRVFLGPALSQPELFEVPTVLLRGPVLAGACGNVVIDASASTGSVGRPWTSIIWSCSGAPDACRKIMPHVPNSCTYLEPGLETAGLALGGTACGMVATVPEDEAAALSAMAATVTVSLRLMNFMGAWSEADHVVRFTPNRVPLAVAWSPEEVFVDRAERVKMEIAVGAALSASSSGAGGECASLGTVAVEWKVGMDNLPNDLDEVWAGLSPVPATLQASLISKLAVLQGFLGSLDVAGTNWTIVARTSHTSGNAEPVYLPFRVAIRPENIGLTLEAPADISEDCSFEVVAKTHGVSPSTHVTWRCMLMEFASGAGIEGSACAAAVAGVRSSVLMLPNLSPGVYELEGTVEAGARPTSTILVRVHSRAGPRVHILEPSAGLRATSDPGSLMVEQEEVLRFRATLAFGYCSSGSYMRSAIIVRSMLPAESGLASARPHLTVRAVVVNASSYVTADATLEAWVDLNSLPVGLSHSFQLLVADGVEAQTALTEYKTNLDASVPLSLTIPDGVWSYSSEPVTRVSTPALAAFVDPNEGLATRTLFRMRARTLCHTGCEFSFRLAVKAADADANAVGCDLAGPNAIWEEIRQWGLEPEAQTPLLAGVYMVEARARSPTTGGTARACTQVTVTDSDPSAALAALALTDDDGNIVNPDGGLGADAPTEATEIIVTWTSDASRSIATLRALGQADSLAYHLRAVAAEFPLATSLAPLVQELSASAMRGLYNEFCEAVVEAALSVPVSAFAPAKSWRRLATLSDLPPLESATYALLQASQALGPLLTLPEAWRSLAVLETVLDRNLNVNGKLGSNSSTPKAAIHFLQVLDLALATAETVDNTTSSAYERNNCSALTDRIMDLALRVGDAAVASEDEDLSGPPREVSHPSADIVLSMKSFSGTALRQQGLQQELTVQTIVYRPYPGISTPPISAMSFSRLSAMVSEKSETLHCLGDGARYPLDRIDLVVVQWGRNTMAIGNRIGSAAPSGSGAVLTGMRDVRVRSCGVDVVLDNQTLNQQQVDMLWQLPDDIVQERRWGYGPVRPFNCVRWISAGAGQSGFWSADGCSSAYRAPGDEGTAETAGLEAGVLRCRCGALIPGTWAVEIVPRPATFLGPETPPSAALGNVVTYGVLILWLPILLPLLIWAFVGDLLLALGGSEAKKRLAESILPVGIEYGGVSRDANSRWARVSWPVRNSFTIGFTTWRLYLASLCGDQESCESWEEEAKDLQKYRDQVSAARRAGARVTPLELVQEKAQAQPVEAVANQPQRHQPSRWRAKASQPPESPAAGASNVKNLGNGQHDLSQDGLMQPYGQDRFREDDIGNLLKLGMDDFEEASTKPHLSEHDWSVQVRSQVGNTGIQRNHRDALPEGWIGRRAQSYGGQMYYVNLLNGQSSWDTPQLPAVKSLSTQEIRGLLGQSADHVSLRIELEEMLRPRIAERLASLPLEDGGQQQQEQSSAEALEQIRGWSSPQGRSWSPVKDKEQSPVPPLQLRRDPRHRAPPLEIEDHGSGLVIHGTELREAAHAGNGAGSPQKGSPQKPQITMIGGSIVMPLRFESLAWGRCGLFWRCFVRSWPLTAALQPRLRPSRLARCALLAYRWSAALAVATCVASQQSWGHVPTEAIVAAGRPEGELWGEVGAAFSLVLLLPLGIGSDLAGRFLAALLPAFPVATGKDAETVSGRMAWWRMALNKQHQTEVAALLFASIASVLAVFMSSLAPQARAAVALAAFLVVIAADLLVFPVLRALFDTITLSCGSTITLAKWPSLFFFGPRRAADDDSVTSWTSRSLLLQYSEALAAELGPLRHWNPKR